MQWLLYGTWRSKAFHNQLHDPCFLLVLGVNFSFFPSRSRIYYSSVLEPGQVACTIHENPRVRSCPRGYKWWNSREPDVEIMRDLAARSANLAPNLRLVSSLRRLKQLESMKSRLIFFFCYELYRFFFLGNIINSVPSFLSTFANRSCLTRLSLLNSCACHLNVSWPYRKKKSCPDEQANYILHLKVLNH